MTTMIEARRLNGTDFGKSIGNFGTLQAVEHRLMTVQVAGDHQLKSYKIVRIETSAGTFLLWPSSKVAVTGPETPEVKP
ncbi:hypothetical protein [Arthrobacter sp. JUb115]|uniref:hypothetical protein n=1 Tax=Arthrobacter sp. JUb115 TaxID=2485108 RepID=UPI00106115F5|nr:hypothetical protein [Arthrobacter sp. JUb115]TDU27078.1 hypothetical protein EDF61_104154 [Arthrobacter sp. JUb115]